MNIRLRWEKLTAGMAKRGEKDVEQRPEEHRSQPHIFVDHQDAEVGCPWFAVDDSGYPTDPLR